MWQHKQNIQIPILQFPGSMYAIETRNPGPMYANRFFQLVLCEKNHKKERRNYYQPLILELYMQCQEITAVISWKISVIRNNYHINETKSYGTSNSGGQTDFSFYLSY